MDDKRSILSLDLSLAQTGYSVWKNKEIIEFGSIKTDPRQITQNRLKYIGNGLSLLLFKHDYDIIVIEKPFHRYNTSTGIIYEVHGVAQYIFSDITQVYIPAVSVKKLITGNGRSSKEQVQEFIKILTGIQVNNNDESDAIAVGLAYLIKEGFIDKNDTRRRI